MIHLPEAKTPHLDFGNLVHGTLESYFNECKNKNKILNKKSLEENFEKVLALNPSYQEFKTRGWEILEEYFDERATSFEIPTENEFRIPALSFELRDGHTINLTGVVDKITRTSNGDIVVWDYKTGKAYSDMDKDRKEKIKRQAVFYKLLLRHTYQGRYDFQKVTFDFVEKNSKGEYEQVDFEITESDLNDVREIIQKLADDVFGGNLLNQNYTKDEKTKDYIELLDLIKGEPEQGELFL